MLVFLVCLMGLFVMLPDVEWRGARTATLQPGHGDKLRLFGDIAGTLSQIVEELIIKVPRHTSPHFVTTLRV